MAMGAIVLGNRRNRLVDGAVVWLVAWLTGLLSLGFVASAGYSIRSGWIWLNRRRKWNAAVACLEATVAAYDVIL